MAKYLDYDGVLYFWQKCKAKFALITHTHTKNQITDFPTIPSKTSDLTNDSGYITSADVPEGPAASMTTPLMDGTAAVGSETAFARGDHRHPSDTSRVPTTRKVNGHALSADVTLDADDISNALKLFVIEITVAAEANSNEEVWTSNKTSSQIAAVMNNPNYLIVVKRTNGGTGCNYEVPDLVWYDNIESLVTIQLSLDRLLINYDIDSAGNVEKESFLYAMLDSSDKLPVNRLYTGVANGVASLDSSGKVPASQLPSYVDDVIEAYARSGQTALSSTWLATGSASGTVITPEAGKIYVLMADSGDYAANTQFRWGGSAYVKLADGGVSAITNAEIDTICV